MGYPAEVLDVQPGSEVYHCCLLKRAPLTCSNVIMSLLQPLAMQGNRPL